MLSFSQTVALAAVTELASKNRYKGRKDSLFWGEGGRSNPRSAQPFEMWETKDIKPSLRTLSFL